MAFGFDYVCNRNIYQIQISKKHIVFGGMLFNLFDVEQS